MATTGTGAFEAMLTHHAALTDGVARRVAAVESAVKDGSSHAPAVAALVAYMAQEVLPHAAAEEQTVYRSAADRELAETVAGMIDEHRQLAASIERLATAASGTASAGEARGIGGLFAAHVAKENDLILPPLVADEEVDLAGLLAEMHRLTEAGQEDATPVAELARQDTEARLVRLLLDAAGGMAGAGQGDRACRVAAEAWAVVRGGRPDLAVRVTAALHRLVRSVTAAPVTWSPGRAGAGNGSAGGTDAGAELDVRALAPAQRHEKIFATYAALGRGTGFVLINDHDPKPLRYQFEAEHAGRFSWDVLEAGPSVWRVRIGRPAGTLGDGSQAERSTEPEPEPEPEPELDVRQFSHGQRHDVIFTTFDALAEGAGFVLVNDHDPKPLRYQFEAQHAGSYSWDYLEAGPERWRVRIGRAAARVGA